MAAAKGGVAAKSAGAMGLLAAICSPLLIVFGNYLGYRIGVDEAHTEEERQFIKTFYRRILSATAMLTAVFAVILLWLRPPQFSLLAGGGMVFMAAVIFYLLAVVWNIISCSTKRRKHFAKILAEEHAGIFPKPAFEYRSRTSFLGLPLVHLRIGDRFDAVQKPVKAWFAMGNYAIGGILAFGGIAIAPIGLEPGTEIGEGAARIRGAAHRQGEHVAAQRALQHRAHVVPGVIDEQALGGGHTGEPDR